MEIKLTPKQEAWLAAHVSAGAYATVEEAVQSLLDERIAEEQDDDLEWAKPYLDEARAEIERGEGISHDNFKAFLDQKRKSLRDA